MSFLDHFPERYFSTLDEYPRTDIQDNFKQLLTEAYQKYEDDYFKKFKKGVTSDLDKEAYTKTLEGVVLSKPPPHGLIFKDLLILTTRYLKMINDALSGDIVELRITIIRNHLLLRMWVLINFMRETFLRIVKNDYPDFFYPKSEYPEDVVRVLSQMGGRKRKSKKREFKKSTKYKKSRRAKKHKSRRIRRSRRGTRR